MLGAAAQVRGELGDSTKVIILFIYSQMLITQYILLFLFLFVVEIVSLPRFGVSKELSHEEFSRRLRCAKDLEIAKLRLSI